MEYCLATIADAAGIAKLIQTTWDTVSPEDHVADTLARPGDAVWIVKEGETLVGFCAGFITLAADGTSRWEIDLLAVEHAARGMGIGRALITRSVQTGRQRGAALCRGLVAVDNPASARCFEVNGFRSAAAVCDLWVGPPIAAVEPAPQPDAAHLIAVDTLTYRGVWVEGRFDKPTFAAAQHKALTEGRNTVGAVIARGMPNDCEALNFAHINAYQWWVIEI